MLTKTVIGALFLAAGLSAAATDTRLADAAMQDDKEAVRGLLRQKADVNAAQGDGSTALHWSVTKDDLEMTRLLLQAGASVKAQTRIGSITPLFMACKSGNADIVESLLKAGADANAANDSGTTPLMMAAASGSAAAVKVLLDHGAYINARETTHGQTALMFAAALNREAAVRMLMLHGADSNVTTKVTKPEKFPREPEDNPMPDEVAKDGAKDAAVRKRGGGRGAAPDSNAPVDGKAPTEVVPVISSYEPTAAELKTQVAELKSEGAALHAQVEALVARLTEVEKHTPGITLAAAPTAKAGSDSAGRGGAAKPGEEMRGPRDFGPALTGGMTALLFASRDGQIDAVRTLVEAGSDINEGSAAEKTTPLVLAISNGHYDVAKYLLDHGADPNLANVQGLAALYATLDVHWAGHSWFPGPVTAQEKVTYLDLMKDLIAHRADPNARLEKKVWFRTLAHDATWVDPAGATPFWRAAQASDVEAMHLLIAAKADPKIPTSGGDTALMVAAGLGWGANFSVNAPDSWITAVKYCLELGLDVNAADTKGNTALHGAAYIGNNEIVNLLVQKGAKVDVKTKAGDTVADMANGPNRFGIPHPETVALLEKLGSANSHNCRSDQCLVAPKEDKKDEKKPVAVPPVTPGATPGTTTPDAHLSKPGPPGNR